MTGDTSLRRLPMFTEAAWQMSYGERAALEGVLQALRPSLAIELGRAEGGSLRRIAASSGQALSFDLVEPAGELGELDNVTMFTGDSHRQLSEQLAELAAAGRNVDFVLVDGDHSAPGVRADMVDLLQSPALRRSVILAHDSLNEDVRAGLDSVDYEAYAKVVWVDLDFVPGAVAQLPGLRGQCWGGLGLVIVDEDGGFSHGSVRNPTLFPAPEVVWPWARSERETNGAPPATGNDSMRRSLSWQLTAPLRAAMRRLRDR